MSKVQAYSFLLLAALALAALWWRNGGTDERGSLERRVVIDTVVHHQTVLRDSVVVRYVTRRLPVADTAGADVRSRDDSVPVPDSVEVVLPVEQKVYSDSDYTAYVSGVEPCLDSIVVYPKTVYVSGGGDRGKAKRFGVGLQLGVGANKDGVAPYIGVGVSYNLFGF